MHLKDNDIETLRILEDVYRGWEPNEGQVKAGRALFHDNQNTQFIRWGRKGGKTEYIIKAIYRYALLHPNAGCYYFCPQANQAREILWETGRLQRAIPKKYIKTIKSVDMRIILNNGSFIKLDGSDNYEKHRGTEPHFLVYDEFKDFDRRFHEAIDPNRGVYNCPLVIIGTPPISINEDRNYEQYMELQEQCRRDDDKFFLQLSSYVNCHNVPKPDPKSPMHERIKKGKAYLAKKRQELVERGEEYRWKIEYMAENVSMGKNAVFPMLGDRHVFEHDVVINDLLRDERKLEWYCIADPATSTCFGVLFVALNPYSREVWVLDEIYEKDREETSTSRIIPKIISKMKELAPNLSPEDDWVKVYDEREAWFSNEAMTQVDSNNILTFNETQKFHNPKEDGIGLAKDTLIYNMVHMSDRCVNFNWELEQYVCIDGKYPKKHDHLIDCYRYFLADSGYTMIEALEAKREKRVKRKLRSVDDLYDELDLEDDWTRFLD